MEKVSLKMIANQVGVSVATVSLVLNGKDKNGRVSKEMSKKVLDKAAELHYVPNSLAKGLKMGRSKTIGLIIADISNVFFGTLALHIQNYAEKVGYTVVIGNTNEKLEEMEKLITLFNARQVDGLMITPTEGSEELTKSLIKYKKPVVFVDRSFPELEVSSVLINNYEIAYIAAKQLIKRGCKNPAFITYQQDQFHINERKRGFIEAVKEAGMYNSANIQKVRYDFLTEDMNNIVSQLLKRKPKIDGIFFATNSISISGVKSLFQHQIELQKDIEIMCFDESEAFYLLPFSVPFVKQPIEKMAKDAIRLLINQVENRSSIVENDYIEAELVL